MKTVLFVVAMVIGLSAHAGDRKVGNIIAVEREISDIYTICLKKTGADTSKPQDFFSCGFKYVSEGEIAVSSGRFLKLSDDTCSVIGESINGALLITYSGTKKPSTFETSRACLEKAITAQGSVKMMVFTVE